MAVDSRVVDLLVRFEESRERGSDLTPEELCRDCPDLLPQLRDALQAVHQFPTPSGTHASIRDGSTEMNAGGHANHAAMGGPASSARFTVLRPHAKGGLGEVLVAKDVELRREVAFKRIQPQLATNVEARRRFLREAEITAKLEHPGIVPIYGLISDADGQPSYAMRFVQGESLADAIRRFHAAKQPFDGLAFRHLLQQFITVCQTMAYAHSRAIIHRDLKPANVMLGTYGETLVVDWGLAKEIGVADDAETALAVSHDGQDTRMGQTFGTPSYMPPEQAAGRWIDVGPASDIYSLGATLYELIVGQRPISSATISETLERVKRGEFPAPRQVRPNVPRALQAVCLKAMALKPSDRYVSAAALAEDVEHWLADEAVSAFAEPRSARLARWARKHPAKVGIIGTGLLMAALALAVGLGVVGRLNGRLDSANRELSDKKQTLDRTNTDLQQTKGVFEKVSGILSDVAKDIDPRTGKNDGESLKVQLGKRLNTAAALLENESAGDPVAVARLQARIAVSLIHLSHYQRAIELLTQARQTLSTHLGPEHVETLDVANHLASVLRAAGRLDEALPIAQATWEARRRNLGPSDSETATSEHIVGAIYKDKGRNDLALPLLEKSFKTLRAREGPDDHRTLTAMNNLAVVLLALDRHAEAASLTEEMVRRTRAVLGPEHPDTAAIVNTQANVYVADGRVNDALHLMEDCYRSMTAKLGADHHNTIVTRNNLAVLHQRTGNYSAAMTLMVETVKLFEAKLGPKHADTLMANANLGHLYMLMRRLNDARELLEKTLTALRTEAGPTHIGTLNCLGSLGTVYRLLGRSTEAIATLDESLRQRTAVLGAEHPDTLTAKNELGLAYTWGSRPADGVRLHEELLKLRTEQFGPDHRLTLLSMANLADANNMMGKRAEALQIGEAAWKKRLEKFGPEDADSLYSTYFVGNLYFATGRRQEGLELLQRSVVGLRKVSGADAAETLNAQNDLGVGYMLNEEFEKAIPLFQEILPKRRMQLGDDHMATITATVGLALSQLNSGRFADAEPALRDLVKRVRTTPSAGIPPLSEFLAGHALALLGLKRYADAEPVVRECLALREKSQASSWQFFNTKSLLGEALAGQAKYAEAEPLLLEGYKGMKEREEKIPPLGRRRLAESIERLVRLYDAWGKKVEADKWRRTLAEHRGAAKK